MSGEMPKSRYSPARAFNRKVSAREDILTRVRQGLGRAATPDPAAAERVSQTLSDTGTAPRITLPDDLVGRFIECSLAASSTVDRVKVRSAVPQAVSTYLRANALSFEAAVWPEFADLDWADAGLKPAFRAAAADDLVGITGCFCALAETGTLMLLSGPRTAATTSLLPETHIAVVPESRIVIGMEEGFALLRAERGDLPRSVNFVSGPSRTGDIEQTIVLGAHGPYRVHLILVAE
jgi:L-lactate dehydrogenase complex protein LldG